MPRKKHVPQWVEATPGVYGSLTVLPGVGPNHVTAEELTWPVMDNDMTPHDLIELPPEMYGALPQPARRAGSPKPPRRPAPMKPPPKPPKKPPSFKPPLANDGGEVS